MNNLPLCVVFFFLVGGCSIDTHLFLSHGSQSLAQILTGRGSCIFKVGFHRAGKNNTAPGEGAKKTNRAIDVAVPVGCKSIRHKRP